MTKGKKTLAIAAGVLLLVLIGIQLIPVSRTNPPVTAEIQAPAPVQHLLERSCYDCHSHETRWPWYSHVAPASWFLAYHVDHGREYVNFSEWGKLDADQRTHLRDEIFEEVEKGAMPLSSYLWLHPGARVSPEELRLLETWSREGDGGSDEEGERQAHEGHEH